MVEIVVSMEEDTPLCRYCHSTDNERGNTLISPCQCNGSMQYVHEECLATWRSTGTSARDKCTMCQQTYFYGRFDIAVYSRPISYTLFAFFFYFMDVNTLLFHPEIAVPVWKEYGSYLCLFGHGVIIHLYLFARFETRSINFDRLLYATVMQWIISSFIHPYETLHYALNMVFLYEVWDSSLTWIIGNPRIIDIGQP